MTILAVDNDPDRLWELVRNLRLAFPGDTVEYTHDPLMAGRFVYNKPVDMLFAELAMGRMDGFQMSDFVRRRNPKIQVCLLVDKKEFGESSIWEEYGIDGCLTHPVTLEKLRKAAIHLQAKQKTG